MVQWIASSPEKLVDFTIPGSNPTTTFTIYLYLNHSSHVVYQSFEYLASAMHQHMTLTYYKYDKSIPNLTNPLNECHRHLNVESDLNNDDIPVSKIMTNMIHENHKFVHTIHSLRRNFDSLYIYSKPSN